MNDLIQSMSKQAVKTRASQRKETAAMVRDRLWGVGKVARALGLTVAAFVALSASSGVASGVAGLAAHDAKLSGVTGLLAALLSTIAGLGLLTSARRRFALGNRWNDLHNRWSDLEATADDITDETARNAYSALDRVESELRAEENQPKSTV